MLRGRRGSGEGGPPASPAAAKRRLADCPECAGKLVSHFDRCSIGAAAGVCALCEGSGRGTGTKPCTECKGSGRAPKGHRDLAYWLVRAIDSETREMCR